MIIENCFTGKSCTNLTLSKDVTFISANKTKDIEIDAENMAIATGEFINFTIKYSPTHAIIAKCKCNRK